MDATPDEVLTRRRDVERVACASVSWLIERDHAGRRSEVTALRCLRILANRESAGQLAVLRFEVEARRDDGLVRADGRDRGIAPDRKRGRRERRETRAAAEAHQSSVSRRVTEPA